MNNKYKWMKPFQRELFEELCKEFGFKDLTAVGDFLELGHPYHGAKLIFEAQKQNNYLKKILEIQKKASKRIKELEEVVNNVKRFKSSMDNAESNLSISLEVVKNLRKF